MLTSILGIILVIVLGFVMCYFANLQGHNQLLMAIASFIFILYLVIKDFMDKWQKKKEEDAKNNKSSKASTSVFSKKSKNSPKGSISDIAHRSTKNK